MNSLVVRRIVAAVVGVGVSIGSSLIIRDYVIGATLSRVEGFYVPVLLGLVIGSVVAGLILNAHGWRGWLGAVALVFGLQFAIGLILAIIAPL